MQPPRDGIVVIDKPAGWTSQQVVSRIKHRLAAQWGMRPKTLKVGHAGTLDPMATGVLVVGVGRATKVLGTISGHDKCYEATIRLGQSTTTDDAEGEPTATVVEPVETAHAQVLGAMAELTGDILQVPSAVSAIKVDGKRAYALVRAGETVELKPRPVRVARFDAVAFRAVPPFLDIDVVVECSSGTYVRALARDLGRMLGVGGHLTALRRTRVGDFGIDQAIALDDVTASAIVNTADQGGEVGHSSDSHAPSSLADHRRGETELHRHLPKDRFAARAPHLPTSTGMEKAALALGTFDGVHLGHRAVLAAARASVGDDGVVTAVTFWPHPMSVFAPGSAPPLLQSLDAREDALLEAGADEVLLLHFTPEMAALSPSEFVELILVPMQPAAVAVGPDFTFGAHAAGTPATLAELAVDRFDVIVTPTVEIGGLTDSSTAIRTAVAAGDMESASHLLGRDFAVRGTVVHGDQRGRALGFPTANLLPDDAIVTPPDGVYAGWLRRLDEVSTGSTSGVSTGEEMPAAVSVGDNPTFAASRRVEAHVLDVDIDLYDAPVEIGFIKRLRGMIKFDNVDGLIAQMRQDVANTRTALT